MPRIIGYLEHAPENGRVLRKWNEAPDDSEVVCIERQLLQSSLTSCMLLTVIPLLHGYHDAPYDYGSKRRSFWVRRDASVFEFYQLLDIVYPGERLQLRYFIPADNVQDRTGDVLDISLSLEECGIVGGSNMFVQFRAPTRKWSTALIPE
jgi:hypothetical protein